MSQDTLDQHILVYSRAIYANYTLTMVGAGVHIFMALYGLSVFLETPMQLRKGRKRYILTSFVIAGLYSFIASLDMADFFPTLLEAQSPRHWMQLLIAGESDWERRLSMGILGFLISIGDALLVYRCYMVYVEYWWVTILPGVTALTAAVLYYLGNYSKISSTYNLKILTASALLTVITNVILTSLIIFRLVCARRTLSKILPSSDGKRIYMGVINIVIESAAPLTLFGVIAVVLRVYSVKAGAILSESPGFIVCTALFDGLFLMFCTISPHMIIFRVTTGRSFTTSPTSKSDGPDGLNTLRFVAQETVEPSFLRSTLNCEFGRNCDLDSDSSAEPRKDDDIRSRITETGSVVAADLEKGYGSGDVKKSTPTIL